MTLTPRRLVRDQQRQDGLPVQGARRHRGTPPQGRRSTRTGRTGRPSSPSTTTRARTSPGPSDRERAHRRCRSRTSRSPHLSGHARRARRDERTYDNIAAMDRWFGAQLDRLKSGLADSTVVFFFSDHGVGLPRGKRSLCGTGTRVPLLVRSPRAGGRRPRPGHLREARPSSTSDRPSSASPGSSRTAPRRPRLPRRARGRAAGRGVLPRGPLRRGAGPGARRDGRPLPVIRNLLPEVRTSSRARTGSACR